MQKLSDLALELVEQEDPEEMSAALREKDAEFHKTIKKSLLQKRDEVMYEALERTRYASEEAYGFLRSSIEEAAEVVQIRREDGGSYEINAFVIPVFVQSTGGLHADQCFQDQDAFDLLTKSLKAAQLESPDANVVLVAHAYHLDEIDNITFSQINEMTRDAYASMSAKKASTAAIEASMAGWPESTFGPDDAALELRFLLGFALKTSADPFYVVPVDEAAADAYFDERAVRFQRWSEQAAPLLSRCLSTDGRELALNFLYQDLFHGGKHRGMSEQYMLQMMSELNAGLDESGATPDRADAIVGPFDLGGELVLRVRLYDQADQRLLASADKALLESVDLEGEFMDTCDALTTLGVKSLALAASFDADGKPQGVRPYEM